MAKIDVKKLLDANEQGMVTIDDYYECPHQREARIDRQERVDKHFAEISELKKKLKYEITFLDFPDEETRHVIIDDQQLHGRLKSMIERKFEILRIIHVCDKKNLEKLEKLESIKYCDLLY